MALADLTADAVVAALNEYDDLGGPAFRDLYDYGRAKKYFIHRDGKTYDSKAIAGVAHGYLPGQRPLRSNEFTGGDASVVRRLRLLGFRVPPEHSPAWVRDEVILACDLVAQNQWHYFAAEDPRVVDLSGILQTLPFHDLEVRSDTFRSASEVARKTVDLATHYPDNMGGETKVEAIDNVVIEEFLADPVAMHEIAEELRKAAMDDTIIDQLRSPVADEDAAAREGRLLQRQHFVRERDLKLRRRKITSFLKNHDRVHCEACSFDFEAAYGDRGHGYIEVHHTRPLHDSGETTTKLSDLVLLCANCHRVVHCKTPWLTFDQLLALVSGDGTSVPQH